MTTTDDTEAAQDFPLEEFLVELIGYANGTLLHGIEAVSDDHSVRQLWETIEYFSPPATSAAAVADHYRNVALVLVETAARLSAIASAATVQPDDRDAAIHAVARDDTYPRGWWPTVRGLL
jgi:hypothetical protein